MFSMYPAPAMPPGGHVDQGLEGGDGRQDAEAHKVLKGVGADAPRVAGGGDAVGQAEHVRRDPRGVPGEVDVVVDEAGEHQAAGAVDDLLHVRGVDVAVLRRRDDPAAGDEHVRLPVQAPGGVDHTAAPQPEVIFLCRFHDFHALTLLSGPRSQGRCPEYLEKALAGPSPGLFFLRPIQTG